MGHVTWTDLDLSVAPLYPWLSYFTFLFVLFYIFCSSHLLLTVTMAEPYLVVSMVVFTFHEHLSFRLWCNFASVLCSRILFAYVFVPFNYSVIQSILSSFQFFLSSLYLRSACCAQTKSQPSDRSNRQKRYNRRKVGGRLFNIQAIVELIILPSFIRF